MKSSGPTEQSVHNGKRVRHIAFYAPKIEDTFQELKDRAQGFLLYLVGSPTRD